MNGNVTYVTFHLHNYYQSGSVFPYKSRYIAGLGLVEIAILTNRKPMIYINLCENMDPAPWPIQYALFVAHSLRDKQGILNRLPKP